MLKHIAAAIFSLSMLATPSLAAPEVGKLAPDFHAPDINGAEQSLSQYRGKIIVLEWHNPECPFVVKHYGSGNMQKLQADAKAKDVVWLTINSGAEGKQGHMTAAEAKEELSKSGSASAAYILDPKGEIGRLYEAKTTPHMFVVDGEGILAYAGAIDDKASFDPEDIKTSKNYVSAAIEALQTGAPVVTPNSTRSYGCSVKYGD